MRSIKNVTPALLVLLSLFTFTAAATQDITSSAAVNMSTSNMGKSNMSTSSAVSKNMKLTFEEIAQKYVQNPDVVGEARLKIMFWDIYDAKLSAMNGEYQEGTPMALSLSYLRDFDGEDIASRSIDEMRDLGYKDEILLAKWFEQMRSLFPNVKKGENITGALDEKQSTHFYYQGMSLGIIEDVNFSKAFFGIWLNENTSEPKMRKKLLGIR
jgi:hypothetical protein